MSVSQNTANALKGKDAEFRGLKVTEEIETEINAGDSNGATVSATSYGSVKRTVITLTATPLTVTDAAPYTGVKVFDFPAMKAKLLAASASLQIAVTSDRTATINNNAAMDYSFGSAVEATDTTLDGTQADIIPKVDITLDGVAAALSTAAAGDLATATNLASGTDVYLNVSLPTGTDIDANGTITVTGTLVLVWCETL